MVVHYLPIAMVVLAFVQSILLLCIFVQVHRANKQQPLAMPKKAEKTKKIEKPVEVTFRATASPILPWLRHASRDDMIDSFRVLAEAQQNERK